MQTEQGNTLLSLQAVQEFLARHADKLPDVMQSGARERLDAAIIALEGHVSEQTGSQLHAQGATGRLRTLRAVLLRHMKRIARIARADLPRTPELAPLRMPWGKPTGQRLAAAASSMAKAAAPHAAVFVAAGQRADFIARLEQAADALVVSLKDRVQSRSRRKGATGELKAKLAAGRKIVGMIDAFVEDALTDEPELLTRWRVVKHVSKTRVRSTVTEPAPVTAAA
jgi:hypothetical protein